MVYDLGIRESQGLLALLIVLSLFLSERDIREKAVPLWGVGVFVALCVYRAIRVENFLMPFLSFLVLTALCGLIISYFRFYRQRPGLQWADVVLLSTGGLWLQPLAVPYFLMAVGGLGIVTALFWRYVYGDHTYPLVPAICGGLLLILWIGF